jgi:hypothetical protein
MYGTIPPLPSMPSWRGARLKHRDNFIFTFTRLLYDGTGLRKIQIQNLVSCRPKAGMMRD